MPFLHTGPTITKKFASEFITWTFRIALMSIVSIATHYAAQIEEVNTTVTKLAIMLPSLEHRVELLERLTFRREGNTATTTKSPLD